jgi:hypothetical protein
MESITYAGQLRMERKLSEGEPMAESLLPPSSGLSKATAMLLRTSWLTMPVSPFTSLLYINLHAFMRCLFPSLFCKLGEEWIPGQNRLGAVASVRGVNRAASLVEYGGLFLLDLGLLFMLIVVPAIVLALIDSFFGIFSGILSWFI